MKEWRFRVMKSPANIFIAFITLVFTAIFCIVISRLFNFSNFFIVAPFAFIPTFIILMKKFGVEDIIITIENNELIVKNKYFKIYHDYSLVGVERVYTEYSIVSRLSPFSGGSRHFVLTTKQGLKTTLFNYNWFLWANNSEICDQINAEIKEFATRYDLK